LAGQLIDLWQGRKYTIIRDWRQDCLRGIVAPTILDGNRVHGMTLSAGPLVYCLTGCFPGNTHRDKKITRRLETP
jgi:hypothetical protein